MAQSDILTITLNPALDLSATADRVEAGPKLRCSAPRRDPGGGGINVSRAIRYLGGESTALVALGGAIGSQMQKLMAAEGLRPEILTAPGETRQSLSVSETGTGAQYRFVMPGPVWAPTEVSAVLQACTAQAGRGGLVVLSGSLPPGLPDILPSQLGAALAPSRTRLVVDTSGPALRALATAPGEAPPFLLRFDHAEACELSGRALASAAETAEFAEKLVRRGTAQAVMIARGAEGNVLVADGARHICRPTPVEVRSKVGAGDSFVAAAILALARGETLLEALRHGTAAANAAVMTEATELCRAEDVARLRPLCVLEPT